MGGCCPGEFIGRDWFDPRLQSQQLWRPGRLRSLLEAFSNAFLLFWIALQDFQDFWFQAGHAGGFADGYGFFVRASLRFLV